MHAPYILSADDLGDSLEFCRKPSISEADDPPKTFYRNFKSYDPPTAMDFAFPHLRFATECGNCLRVGVRAKNASLSGFACRPFHYAGSGLPQGAFLEKN